MPAALPDRPTSAAFFDLDKTIIAGSSALAFSRPFRRQGMITRRAVLRSGYAQLLLVLSGADADTMESLRRRITALCAGWEVAQVRSIVAETLHEIVEPLVYAEATALIAEHRAAGDEVVVLSASGQEVVEPIAAMVGADRCLASRMRVAEGRYTGEVEFYLYGEEKARAARDIAAARGYRLEDCRAYSDSITDLPLLESVGHPTVVNPDKALRRLALERGWPVLTFSAPVPLGVRLRPARRAAIVASGMATALLAVLVRRSVRSRRSSRCVPEPVHLGRPLAVACATGYKYVTDSWKARGGAAEKHPSSPTGAPCASAGHSTHSTPREACRRGPAYRDAGRRGRQHDT